MSIKFDTLEQNLRFYSKSAADPRALKQAHSRPPCVFVPVHARPKNGSHFVLLLTQQNILGRAILSFNPHLISLNTLFSSIELPPAIKPEAVLYICTSAKFSLQKEHVLH